LDVLRFICLRNVALELEAGIGLPPWRSETTFYFTYRVLECL
jgi:hypothetical protein